MQRPNSEADSPPEPHDDLRRTAKPGRAEAGAPKTAALHDMPPRLRPAGTVTSTASEITFPKFDPIADDPDDRPAGASRDALGNIPERAGAVRGRTRTPRRRLVPVLLLAVVLLQVWPSYIWLRNHLNRRSASQATPAAAPMASAGADEGPPPGGSAPTATTGASNVPGPVAGEAALPPRTAPPSSAATTGTLPAPATPRREAARDGLVSLVAPVPAQVFADGKPIGTMERGVIKLPAGRHNLEFVNDEVGYRASQSITVTPSRTAQVRLAAPSGTLSINAVPWAEVWIDNSPSGQTPIANVRAPIGRREVVLRHPDYGERRFTVLVTLKETARVSVDFTRR